MRLELVDAIKSLVLAVKSSLRSRGANQKTCYREALKAGADIVVMVYPDYQYDPTLLPDIIRPIPEGKADVARVQLRRWRWLRHGRLRACGRGM